VPDGLDVDLPCERVTIIEPVFRPAVADPHTALTAALRAPLGRPPLREIVRRGQTVAISVCDITRAQPRQETLARCSRRCPTSLLRHHDSDRDRDPPYNTPAAGDHARPDIARRYRVVNHDSRDRASLGLPRQDLDRRGGLLESCVDERGHQNETGFVEPHFFAGFSGGAEDGGHRARRSRDGARAARRSADWPPERDVGYHRGQSHPR